MVSDTGETVNPQDIDEELARRKFEEFLDFVWIQDTDLGSTSPKLKFEKWPHLLDVCLMLAQLKRIIILKARQIGISWLLAAYALWVALYHPGANVLLLSQGRLEAQKLLGKVKFIFQNLPESLKGTVGDNSGTQFSFLALSSAITALPATEDAGRSETASLVLQDEADYHEHLKENFAAVRPTVDAGGQHIMVSTSNWETMESFFKVEFLRASHTGSDGKSLGDGQSTYARKFLNWRVRPNRDEVWRDQITKDYEPDRKDKEYPETEAAALSPPRTVAFFDHDKLDVMQGFVRPPRTVKEEWGPAYIWQEFVPGRKYAAFTDTAQGVEADSSATVIGDLESGYIVADIFSNTLEPQDLAWCSVQLLATYANPVWGIERNGIGNLTIKKAVELRYPNLFRHRDRHGKIGDVGFNSDEDNRFILYGDLKEAAEAGRLTIPNERGLAEFYGIIKNARRHGRIDHLEGGHDDYPFAVAGLLHMRAYAHRSRGTGAGAPNAVSLPPRRHLGVGNSW